MTDDLSDILERIASGEISEADIAALQQALQGEEGRSLFQLGKYNITIGEGKDIQIGDRTFVEINDAAVQAIVEAIQNGATSKTPAQIDFQPYLQSLVDTYQEWWRYYTLTDATGKIQEVEPESPSPFDFGLMVQTVLKEKDSVTPEANRRQEQQEKIERLPVLEGICKYADDHVLLVGRPGSGKSTALIRLLLEMATQALEQGSGKIPILVELRYWQNSVIDRIQAFLHKHDPTLSLDEITLSSLLRQGHFLLLVDGLNELPSETARTQLASFRQDYSQVPMIFTTRDLGLGGDLGIQKKLEMQPLTEGQMQAFIRAYVPDQAEVMLRQLDNRLREFGQTPLLLWMLCEVFQQSPEHRIPSNLAEIFQAFTRMYEDSSVRKHEVALLKGDVRPLSDRRLWKPALQALAVVMMQGETLVDFRVAIHRDEAEQELSRIFFNEQFPVRDILDDLLKYHLLQNRSADQIEFRHQLIQEYYTAEYLLRLLPELNDKELKRDYLNLLKWTEPIALMLALLDEEDQALRVVKLAINDVDLMLGARLAGEINPAFQSIAVGWISDLELPILLRCQCWANIRSEIPIHELIGIIDTPDNRSVLNVAIKALGQIGSQLAIPRLLDFVLREADISSSTFEMAVDALCKTGNKSVITESLKALKDEEGRIRENAAATLGLIGNQAAIPGLLEALKDEDYSVQNIAGQALGLIGNEAAIPGLLKALKDKDYAVRGCAIEALEKLASNKTTSQLLTALQDCDFGVRFRAARALGKIGDEAAIEALYLALNEDPASRVCEMAVGALGAIGNKAAIPLLLEVLKIPYCGDMIIAAAIALGQIGSEAAVPGLLEVLEDDSKVYFPFTYTGSRRLDGDEPIDIQVRTAVIFALGQIGSEAAVTGLLDALRNKHKLRVKIVAGNVLSQIGGKVAVTELLNILNQSTDSQIRKIAAESLGRIGSEIAIPGLILALEDQDWDVRQNAAMSLCKLGSEAGIPTALTIFDSQKSTKHERTLATISLGQVGKPSSLFHLWQRHYHQPDSNIWDAIVAIQDRCKFYNYDLWQ